MFGFAAAKPNTPPPADPIDSGRAATSEWSPIRFSAGRPARSFQQDQLDHAPGESLGYVAVGRAVDQSCKQRANGPREIFG